MEGGGDELEVLGVFLAQLLGARPVAVEQQAVVVVVPVPREEVVVAERRREFLDRVDHHILVLVKDTLSKREVGEACRERSGAERRRRHGGRR